MTEKFHNKYRIPSARLQNRDYGSNGAYFITICTQDREHYFGEIEHGEMVLNETGQQANTCFQEIPHHFPFVEIGVFVVMPNHVHAIIIINKMDYELKQNHDGDIAMVGIDAIDGHDVIVETQNFASLQIPETETETECKPSQKSFNKFGPQSRNLASIVRGYKIGVTKFAKIINHDFAWQTRFHDHIIRNTKSFERIQDYIINNPRNWEIDTFYPIINE